MEWEPVIGLEIHAQLATESKIFSGASTSYGAGPNEQACAVDLALPGTLPTLNEKVLEMAIKFGCAIGADIARHSVFARKNYFYPDLPKGYQISQYDQPIVSNGCLSIALDGQEKSISITRAHLEEDAGKSIHGQIENKTALDLNRAGTPLLEIVSEPELRSSREAVAYMREIYSIVTCLKICDGNMEEGSFRCDANVSVRPKGSVTFGTRTEIKNLNSFRFVERAINFEISRQIEVLQGGGTIRQETRLYDSETDKTKPLRTKEDAHDYRYFPDPDLLPVLLRDEVVTAIGRNLPELPRDKIQRYKETLNLNSEDALVLSSNHGLAIFFEEVLDHFSSDNQLVANWLLRDLNALLKENKITAESAPIKPCDFAALLGQLNAGNISGQSAKLVLKKMWKTGEPALAIIESDDLTQISNEDEIKKHVVTVLENSPEQVKQLRAGKTKVLGFLVGQVMKATGGKADPKIVNKTIHRLVLKSHGTEES